LLLLLVLLLNLACAIAQALVAEHGPLLCPALLALLQDPSIEVRSRALQVRLL
jgi:hypothetical protein